MQRALSTKEFKEEELLIRQRDSREANKLDAELQGQANALQNDTQGFVKIWNLVRTAFRIPRSFDEGFVQIEDDIRSITQQLNSVVDAQSDLPEVLYSFADLDPERAHKKIK